MVAIKMGSERPNTATKTAASAMPGKDMMMSNTRIKISAVHFLAVAAIEPSTRATNNAKPVAPKPMVRE